MNESNLICFLFNIWKLFGRKLFGPCVNFGNFMAGNFLGGNLLSYVVIFGNFMAGNFLGGNFLSRIRRRYIKKSLDLLFELFSWLQNERAKKKTTSLPGWPSISAIENLDWRIRWIDFTKRMGWRFCLNQSRIHGMTLFTHRSWVVT